MQSKGFNLSFYGKFLYKTVSSANQILFTVHSELSVLISTATWSTDSHFSNCSIYKYNYIIPFFYIIERLAKGRGGGNINNMHAQDATPQKAI